MDTVLRKPGAQQVGELLRGETLSVSAWVEHPRWKQFLLHAMVILAGAGLFGATMRSSSPSSSH
jgi:hypothetical protein